MMDVPDSPPTENTTQDNSSAPQTFSSKLVSAANPANANGNAKGARPNAEKETKPSFGAPGSAWSSKKFNDEYDREMQKLTDKDWAPKYGDPLMK